MSVGNRHPQLHLPGSWHLSARANGNADRGEPTSAGHQYLWIKHSVWVLDPIRYPSVDRLVGVLDTEIVKPAEARFVELLARKSEGFRIKDI